MLLSTLPRAEHSRVYGAALAMRAGNVLLAARYVGGVRPRRRYCV